MWRQAVSLQPPWGAIAAYILAQDGEITDSIASCHRELWGGAIRRGHPWILPRPLTVMAEYIAALMTFISTASTQGAQLHGHTGR